MASYLVKARHRLTAEVYEGMTRASETYENGMLDISELDSWQQEIIGLLHELERRGWDGLTGLDGAVVYKGLPEEAVIEAQAS